MVAKGVMDQICGLQIQIRPTLQLYCCWTFRLQKNRNSISLRV